MACAGIQWLNGFELLHSLASTLREEMRLGQEWKLSECRGFGWLRGTLVVCGR